MKFENIIELRNAENSFFLKKNIYELHGYVVLEGLVAIPIKVSYSYDRSGDISVNLKGDNIGKIKFLVDEIERDILSMSDEELICFLTEYDKESIVDEKYFFKNETG
jgi:hypothetical protein